MNPIQRSPLFLSNPYLTGLKAPSAPSVLPAMDFPSNAAASPFNNSHMGGGILEIVASLMQILLQMLNYLFMGNQPANPAGLPESPGAGAPAVAEAPGGGAPAVAEAPGGGAPAGAEAADGGAPAGGGAGAQAGAEAADGGAPAEGGELGDGGPKAAPGASGSSKPSPSGEKNLDRWDAQIEAAAKSTGLPANYIKATLWAESRGNPNDPSDNPDGKHQDLGVMQISDYTYGDVMKNQPNAPRGLKASNPADNIMMGAWELKDKSEKAGGDLFKTSKAYVGTGDAHEAEYARWVQTYMKELDEGKKLSDF